MTIRVTTADFRRSRHYSVNNCPVARAIVRQTGADMALVDRRYIHLWKFRSCKTMPTPAKVARFIFAESPKPFSFRIRKPKWSKP